MITNNDIHDATLLRITVDWQKGTIALVVSSSSIEREIRGEGLVLLECPRRFPWGRSVSINKVATSRGDDSMSRYAIEVQSGDTIVIVCEDLDWADNPA